MAKNLKVLCLSYRIQDSNMIFYRFVFWCIIAYDGPDVHPWIGAQEKVHCHFEHQIIKVSLFYITFKKRLTVTKLSESRLTASSSLLSTSAPESKHVHFPFPGFHPILLDWVRDWASKQDSLGGDCHQSRCTFFIITITLNIPDMLKVWAITMTHVTQNFGYYVLLTELPTYMKNILHFDMKSNAILSGLWWRWEGWWSCRWQSCDGNGDVDGDNENLQAFLTSLCGLSPWEDLSPSTSWSVRCFLKTNILLCCCRSQHLRCQ